ncbi:hypothetical protein VTK26DRAFT_9249 [Humicola hyalothermophila]
MAAMEWRNGRRRDAGPVLDSPGGVLSPRQTNMLSEILPSEVVVSSLPPVRTETGLLVATMAPSTTTPTVATPAPGHQTESAAASTGNGGGLSVAGIAGIVIGVLGGLLVTFVLIWFIVSSRKKRLARRRQQIEDDEKIHGPFSDSAAIRTPNAAPRLSLRPVTQFLPTFTNQNQGERRASRGIALTLNPVSAPSPTHTLAPLNRQNDVSAWERPTLSRTSPTPTGDRAGTSTSLHPDNPFNDTKRLPDEPVSPVSSMGSFDFRLAAGTPNAPVQEPVSPIRDDDDNESFMGAADSASSANPPDRRTSMRKENLPKPLDLTKSPSPLYAAPPSPAGTEYSMHSMAPGQSLGPSASAAAIAAAGGPSQSTVHRVQLDFKPTLDDELELRAGQLVRLLHEYDDGWALCIRLDRSEQGVVPRTCLSTRPVKPRPPQGGGVGNHQQRGGQPSDQRRGHGPGPAPARPRSPSGDGDPRAYETGYNDFQHQQRYGTPTPRAGARTGKGGGGGTGGESGLNPPPGQAY